MESLKELREWFLEDPESRVVAFKIADHYLTKYDENPELTVLPREHIFARPVVEAFAGDTLGYVKWLRKLMRTYLVKGSDPAMFIGEVCKPAQSRGINRRKRLLETEAIHHAVNRGMIRDNPLDKLRYKKRVNEWIKKEYKLLLDAARRNAKNGRLTIEERDELATAFWDELLQKFSAGDVPEA